MPRMKILNTIEQEVFEKPPVFNSVQRKRFFDFPSEIRRLAAKLRTPTNGLCFLLNYGYFKASKRFFSVWTFHPRDIEYVAQHSAIQLDNVDINNYSKQSLHRHQHLILNFCAFRAFDHKARVFIVHEIEMMARSQLKPGLIFWRCVDLLIREKVQIPSYFRLSELILKAINKRKKELNAVIEKMLSQDIRASLDALFVQSSTLDGEPVPSKTAAYKLTLLKKLSQSTKPSKIKERVADLVLLKGLYENLQTIIEVIGFNHEEIRYYATSVIKSEIFQVARRIDEDRYLHIIAFIAYQYYRLQDNLVDVLLTSLRSYQNSSQRENKEQCYAHREKRNQVVKTLVGYLDEQVLGTLAAIRTITENDKLSDTKKVGSIQALLKIREADRRRTESEIALLKMELENELGNNDYYRVLEAKSIRIQNRVSPIIKTITFHGDVNAKELLEAIRYFKDKEAFIDKKAPLGFLKPAEREAVTEENKRFRVSLYKGLLFIHIQSAIKSGTLNLEHSFKYRSLDGYLINRERWRSNKDVLLERAALQELADPQKVLKDLDEALYQQYLTTNNNILNGSNILVNFDKKGAFRLKTPKQDDAESEALQNFFPERHYVPLLEVLSTVNCHSGFLDEFQHWQQRYNRARPPQKAFYAGIIGLGCGIGTRKMARISRQINEHELEHTVKGFEAQWNEKLR